MSHSPTLNRPTPTRLEPHAFLPLPTVHTTFAGTPSECDEIVDTLRGAITAGASALDPILAAITEAAQSLTGATAAVLALRSNGVVSCRARSGETAPDIGSPLSEKSGISGECLRTGKMLRCDDTQKDYRVNPEVCRRLGLRSIAVLPLRSRLEVAGVLEVFSDRPYAFGEAQMTLLGRLAELAEAAQTQDLSVQTAQTAASTKGNPAPAKTPVPLVRGTEPWTHPNESVLRRLGTQVTMEELRSDRKNHLRVKVAAGLLIVLSGLTWWLASSPRHEVAAVKVPAQAQIQPPAAPADDSIPLSLTDITPMPGHGSGAVKNSGMSISVERHPRREAETDSDPEISDVVTRQLTPDSNVRTPQAAAATENGGIEIANSPAEPVSAPKLETVVADGSGALGSVLASPAAVPKFSPTVSQGVSGGVLEHRVEPVYPQQAMALKLEGPVKLEAMVTPEGTVGKVKLVKGQPILAAAAMDAVRQWRYSPYELNGKPVAVQAEIVVNFKAPTQ